jgi:hypothetical protein
LITAYSLEPPVSEAPFLEREVGLRWTQVTTEELAAHLRERRGVVICSEPAPYDEVLAAAPDGSAVLVMISDEGYSRDRLALVQERRAIASVYRQYAATPASLGQIAQAARAFVGDARTTSESGRTALPNGMKGRETRTRMKAWTACRVPVRAVPLGYTSTFSEAFVACHPEAGDTGSLFSADVLAGERATSITFRGNRGLAARIVGMERAARLPNSDIATIDADWSGFAEGDVGASYVEALSASRFALCPPGFVNNDSFRYFEALACGALPVELRVALTHQGIAAARSPRAVISPSWREGLARAVEMDENDRREAARAARSLVTDVLARTRTRLAADLEA